MEFLKKMAKEVKLNIKLNIDSKELVSEITTDIESMRKAWDNAAESIKRCGEQMLSLNNITLGLENFKSAVDTLTAEYRSFSGAMAAANTMAGKGAEEFAALKDQVAELAVSVPLARDELAKGLYQVISNGVPEDNWISFLAASSKSAVGGIANLEEVVKVASTARFTGHHSATSTSISIQMPTMGIKSRYICSSQQY